jgi:tartrate dehydratase alpha subunit/fumarate hydratase class I-like protein
MIIKSNLKSMDIKELEKQAHAEVCANEPEPKCEFCQDTGIVTRTEWVGTDTSYDTEEICECHD